MCQLDCQVCVNQCNKHTNYCKLTLSPNTIFAIFFIWIHCNLRAHNWLITTLRIRSCVSCLMCDSLSNTLGTNYVNPPDLKMSPDHDQRWLKTRGHSLYSVPEKYIKWEFLTTSHCKVEFSIIFTWTSLLSPCWLDEYFHLFCFIFFCIRVWYANILS